MQSIVNAVRQVHLRRPHAEEASQALRRGLILGINSHLFSCHARERTQDRWRTTHRILIEVEAKFLGATFLRSVIRREAQNRLANWNDRQLRAFHRRTSTARACASSPSARAMAVTTGASRFSPLREISCVLEHVTKSATLRPPRACAQPEVGRT